jgi:hypothetical protein
MKSTTFRPADHPHVLENLMPMAWRNQDGTIKNEASIYPLAPNVELGGSGLYTCAPDYLAFLTSILRNDGKVLKPETVDLMFNYRIPDESIMKSEKVKGFFDWGAHPDDVGTEYDHCLCGLVNLKDMKTGKKAGSVRWGGGTKSFWVRYLSIYACLWCSEERRLTDGSGLIELVAFAASMGPRFLGWLRSCLVRCIGSSRLLSMIKSML